MLLQYLKDILAKVEVRWAAPSGYKAILKLALPLIVTMGIVGMQAFVDRLLLAQYSSDAIAASVPAGLIAISLNALFIGLASYVGVFVAQYYGARQLDEVAKIVWQGIYSVFPSFLIVIPVWLALPTLIRWVGHDVSLQAMEVDYARILVLGIPVFMLHASLSGFLSGLGKVAALMWISLLVTFVNLSFDYLLIFGNFGFPAMGIKGAGWATVISLSVAVLIMLAIFFSKHHRKTYNSLKHWSFNLSLYKRLFRFGLPAGLQMQFESLAMTVFVVLIGGIGVLELTAHSIAMNIFMIAIMPMAGFSSAIAIVVGQCLGDGKPELAHRATISAMHLSLPIFLLMGLLLFVFPGIFIAPFSAGMTAQTALEITPLIHDLLKAAALYCLFDALYMMYAGALRGAGDIHFIAKVGVVCSWFLLVIPTAIAMHMFEDKLRWAWVFLVLYMFVLATVCHLRFWRGRWKQSAMLIDEVW